MGVFLKKFVEILRRGDRVLMRKFGDAVEEICGNPETGGQASDEEI